MYIKEKLKELSLPDPLIMNSGRRAESKEDLLLRRKEIKELLTSEVYGKIPSPPDHLSVDVIEIDKSFAAGKAFLYTLRFNAVFGDETCCFKVKSAVPSSAHRPPAVIYLSSTPDIPNKHLPAEEIIDRGYAVFVLPVKEIAAYSSGTHFKDGLARYLSPGRRGADSPGILAMWAWGAMRVMDYLTEQSAIDKDNVAVCANGIQAASALIAGGYDERFKYVIANCAGPFGTAICRDELGGSAVRLIESYPELFSKKFIKSKKPFDKRAYDQHLLLFLSLDRHLLIGSAELDTRGSAKNEFWAYASLSEAISAFNGGIELPELKLPQCDTGITLGRTCYHMRAGCEYFSRDDWKIYLDYIDKNL